MVEENAEKFQRIQNIDELKWRKKQMKQEIKNDENREKLKKKVYERMNDEFGKNERWTEIMKHWNENETKLLNSKCNGGKK